ncbi:MAG: hypothetical protein KKI09_07275 [Spirochaetes bacterium]|nr:hypothetical protein [Spirochaetota bacterium]MBU0955212.1 hypothetical protein [Spirochaetota bacterium]
MATNLVYVVSLLLVRLRKYVAAITVSTIGILMDSLWIGILLPTIGNADMYRLAVYVLASCIVNSMLAMHKRQIFIYAILGYLVLLVSTIFIYVPRNGGFIGELRTVFITLSMLYIPVSITFWFTTKLTNEVISIATNEVSKNRDKARELDQLLNNAKSFMEIGKNLLDYSTESKSKSEAIKAALETISRAAKEMTGETSCADESNKQVLSFATRMQAAVTEQNNILGETSSGITEIMATIQNISQLAEQRKGSMDAVLHRMQQQSQEIIKVLEGFSKIRDSSKEILAVAGSIQDISEKTNMLAMNASIEAAHAGSSGKGFAVISGEIRKLSMETQGSTQAIGQALARNEDVVNNAATIIQLYAKNTETVLKEVQQTFNAIEEIISGLSEVSVGTGQLTQATSRLMNGAHDTARQVDMVTHQLQDSADAVASIKDFACKLDAMLEALNSDFAAIETVLEKVRNIGEQNIENIEQLELELDRINIE